jgi:prephenate dehydrogenase
MRRFGKITIIGVGLIGGSIGLAIKKRKLAAKVIGVFRRKTTLKKALTCRAVDIGTLDLKEGVRDADLVIVATPVSSIPRLIIEAARHVKKGAVITDAGSTKSWIVSEVEKRLGGSEKARFVGSHPMAGSEQTGVESAGGDLFDGSPCIVTKTAKTDRSSLEKVVSLWKALGARVTVMDPPTHDRTVSLISHLPHIVAFSLAGAVPAKELPYAAEGFRDTTRVASSDAKLWADIFLTNRKEAVNAGRAFEGYYGKLIAAIAGGKRKEVLKLLEEARLKRGKIIYGRDT